MRIAIAFNDDDGLLTGRAVDVVAVTAVLEEVGAVEQACRDNGWEPSRVAVGRDPRALLEAVAGCDVLFNLVEAIGGDPGLEPALPWLLEWAGITYTGSSGEALALALDKPLAKARLAAAGVAVPRGCVLEHPADPLAGVPYPAIVKPARHDASHGIDAGSVVANEEDARARARTIIERYRQPALVEEYVPGREINVALLAGEVLPLRAIDFAAGAPALVTYDAKWAPDSPAYAAVNPVFCDDPGGRIGEVARTGWAAIGGRSYGRVDIRLDAAGEPVVLEVNPNPDLSPDAGFSESAAHAGIGYTEMVATIVQGAIARATAPAAP